MRLHPSPRVLALARAAAFGLLAAAVAVAAARIGGDGPVGDLGKVRVIPRPDQSDHDLARCRDMGRAALDDWLCKKLWAEQRDRFLGPARSPEKGKPVELVPSAPALPLKDQSRLQNGAPTSITTAQPDPTRPSAARPKDE